jgi:hypothetical protein
MVAKQRSHLQALLCPDIQALKRTHFTPHKRTDGCADWMAILSPFFKANFCPQPPPFPGSFAKPSVPWLHLVQKRLEVRQGQGQRSHELRKPPEGLQQKGPFPAVRSLGLP